MNEFTYDSAIGITGIVVISEEQMERARAVDPVLQFAERVNQAASKRSEWSTNYTLALYRAFVEEADKQLLATLKTL